MKKVYIDNNVYVDIEMNNLKIEQFESKTDCSFFYSDYTGRSSASSNTGSGMNLCASCYTPVPFCSSASAPFNAPPRKRIRKRIRAQVINRKMEAREP